MARVPVDDRLPRFDARSDGRQRRRDDVGSASGFAAEPDDALPPDVALAYASVLRGRPPRRQASIPLARLERRFGGSSQTKRRSGGRREQCQRKMVGGYAAAADYRVTPDHAFGLLRSRRWHQLELAQVFGTGRSDAFQAGHYGKSYFRAGLSVGRWPVCWFTTNRMALGDQLIANPTGQSNAARGEPPYRYALPITGVIVGITHPPALQVQQDFQTPSWGETDLSGGGFALRRLRCRGCDRHERENAVGASTICKSLPICRLFCAVGWPGRDWPGQPIRRRKSAVFESLSGTALHRWRCANPAKTRRSLRPGPS